MLRIGLPILFLSAPYFVWNYSSFGHLTPISGKIKTTVPPDLATAVSRIVDIFPSLDIFIELLRRPVFFVGLVSFVACVGAYFVVDRGASKRILRKFRWFSSLQYFVLFVAVHYFYTHVFMKGVHSWYFAPEVILFVLAVCSVAEFFLDEIGIRWPKSGGMVVAGGIVLILVTLLFSYHDKMFRKGSILFHHSYDVLEQAYSAAKWVKENIEEDAILASWDCGLLSYYYERKVINLDGLVNSYEFLSYLRSERIEEYVDLMGVGYVVQGVPAAMGGDYGNLRRDQVIFQSGEGHARFGGVVYYVWERRAGTVEVNPREGDRVWLGPDAGKIERGGGKRVATNRRRDARGLEDRRRGEGRRTRRDRPSGKDDRLLCIIDDLAVGGVVVGERPVLETEYEESAGPRVQGTGGGATRSDNELS
jgi:hypothetical protein